MRGAAARTRRILHALLQSTSYANLPDFDADELENDLRVFLEDYDGLFDYIHALNMRRKTRLPRENEQGLRN